MGKVLKMNLIDFVITFEDAVMDGFCKLNRLEMVLMIGRLKTTKLKIAN